jgi:hypothetical protein
MRKYLISITVLRFLFDKNRGRRKRVLLGFKLRGCVGGEEDFIEYGPYGFPCTREFEFIGCCADLQKGPKRL